MHLRQQGLLWWVGQEDHRDNTHNRETGMVSTVWVARMPGYLLLRWLQLLPLVYYDIIYSGSGIIPYLSLFPLFSIISRTNTTLSHWCEFLSDLGTVGNLSKLIFSINSSIHFVLFWHEVCLGWC